MSSTNVRVWRKRMTRSDAQQPTRGAKMPFLRFTKGNFVNEDHATFFRGDFFSDAPWSPAKSKQGRSVEEATISIHVIIGGQDLGIRRMRLSYDPLRVDHHSAPTTHLLYDPTTKRALESANMAGRPVRVWRDSQGKYHMTIG